MGDRGNIGIIQDQEQSTLYLYTHWSGSGICHTLARGLAKCREAGRLDDPAYATRIIFDELTALMGGSTGFGISIGFPPDNEHEIPYLVWGAPYGVLPIVRYGCGEFTVDAWLEAHKIQIPDAEVGVL